MLTTSMLGTLPHPVLRTVSASLLAETAVPGARVRAAVSGATGSGKSLLLDHLEFQYRAAGITVRRDLAGETTPTSGAVLIDDAHTMAEATVARIQALLDEPGVSVVVAFGLWPHSPTLRRLVRALDRHHAPVVLGALSRADIEADLAARGGAGAPAGYIDMLGELTGGMPWLVQHVLDDAADHGVSRTPLTSPALLERIDREINRSDARLRDYLLSLAIGFGPAGRMPAALLESADGALPLAEQARAEGMLLPDGTLIPLVRHVLLEVTPDYRIRDRQRELIDLLAADGRSLDPVARRLGHAGVRDPRVARSLERAADRSLGADPADAVTLYQEAVAAGSDADATAARRAQAAADVGDLDGAARLIDELLGHVDPPDLVRGANVSASVWGHRGMLARSAEIYRWLGPDRVGAAAANAAVAMMGSGDRDGARSMSDAASARRSPTVVSVALTLLAQGIGDSLDPTTTRTLPALVRSSDMMTAAGAVLPVPDLPAAIAAIAAMHCGDLELAASVLDRALERGQGGPMWRPRLLLLSAWVAMQGDHPERARHSIAEATGCGHTMPARDEFLLRALEVGLARRADDVPALVAAWHRARQSVLHVSVDLFGLLPLGELMIAAARLQDSARLSAHISDAWALLGRLGDPPLWSIPLRWSAIQAAILADQPDAVAPHAAALVRAAPHSPLAAVIAGAGRAWMSVLAGSVDCGEVEAAARALGPVGLTWEGSRLAGHAAARANDRKDMARLLACARDLHSSVGPVVGPTVEHASPDPSGSAAPRDESGLSARERQIARLVLDGKTYGEVGEAIFISARTVEHHIARIRRRLGAASRPELLARLRLALDTP